MNPINDYLGPWLERALAPLFSRGLVKVCYGGARQGAHLTDHPKVAAIHLTGSQATYNAIVFGGQPGPGAVPRIAKPVTAELGNVTPYIVVPGQWSRGEMEYWAKMLVFAKGQNAGHNCIAAEVVVTDRGWAQREEFLGVLREAFSQTTNR